MSGEAELERQEGLSIIGLEMIGQLDPIRARRALYDWLFTRTMQIRHCLCVDDTPLSNKHSLLEAATFLAIARSGNPSLDESGWQIRVTESESPNSLVVVSLHRSIQACG